jgi:hypothetical protein
MRNYSITKRTRLLAGSFFSFAGYDYTQPWPLRNLVITGISV